MNTKEITKITELIDNANAILIGAGSGLSVPEGYDLFSDTKGFQKYFGELREKYGLKNIFQGTYFPFHEKEERSSFNDLLYRYLIGDYTGSTVMKELLELVKGKPYFVITSNIDTHFSMNGFREDSIFEIDGNAAGEYEGSDGWKAQEKRYGEFIDKWKLGRVLVLEFGLRSENKLIKEPLMDFVDVHKNSNYVTFNADEIYIPEKIASRSIGIREDLGEAIHRLTEAKRG